MSTKLFSAAWCAQALVAENAASAEILKRFRKPEQFTHVLALEVSDRPGTACYLRYEAGRCVGWTDQPPEEEQVWARFSGPLEHWKRAGTGQAKASNLVIGGKLKLTKGLMKDAVENAGPFDRLVACFGSVDTDWEI